MTGTKPRKTVQEMFDDSAERLRKAEAMFNAARAQLAAAKACGSDLAVKACGDTFRRSAEHYAECCRTHALRVTDLLHAS